MRSALGTLARTLSNRSPVPLAHRRGISWLQPQAKGASLDQLMDTYASVGTVFAIVNRLASATAKCEWSLYRKAKSGVKDDREQITSHAVLDLLENPNPFMSRMELMEAGQQHLDLVGEVDLVLGKMAGVRYPLELWPVMPQRLQPVPDPYTFLAGWVYTGPDGDTVPLGTDELIRARQPNPQDPYRGLGPIQAILTDLDASRFGKEWQRQFFLNSAQPGGILEVDRRLDDDEFDEMTARWREQHQGISKAHRIAVIENGAKYVDAKISQRDMQFAELDGMSRDVIREAFGFPKGMLGTVDDVNRANAEAGEFMFGKWLIEPRLDRWRGMLNRQLLPMFGRDVAATLELDYESPVPENSETAQTDIQIKSAALVSLASAGFDPVEVLDFFGWPALKYEKPEPPQVTVAGMRGAEDGAAPGQKGAGAATGAGSSGADTARGNGKSADSDTSIDMAMRWAVEIRDDGVDPCEPCKLNADRLYRNRESAYADYPNGEGYRLCIGEQYGNSCHCRIVKRRKKSDD